MKFILAVVILLIPVSPSMAAELCTGAQCVMNPPVEPATPSKRIQPQGFHEDKNDQKSSPANSNAKIK